MPPSAIIYDHDGTLVDSLPVVVAASNAVLRARSLPELPAAEIIAGMVLPTAPRMGRHARTDDPTLQRELAREFYLSAHRVGAPLARHYPGVAEAVADLAARGIAQGVVSNNEGRLVRRLMAALGLAPSFRVVWGEEDVPAPKPDPRGVAACAVALGARPADCVYVGDGLGDVQAAHDAGMRVIGVRWGIHTREEMDGAGFDWLVDTAEELRALVERL
jgi:2-phosphoglycolate phosphatase